MKRTRMIFLMAVVLSACSTNTQPDSVPVVTNPAPAGTTAIPTGRVELTGGASLSDWFGIPIMPNAITGDGDEDGYVFTVRSTIWQVRAFYETELPILGWESLPTEDVSTMMFVREAGVESLTINLVSREDEVLVLLIK